MRRREEEPLRFCFRVVAPDKAYTLQADNEMDRRDWMEAVQVPHKNLWKLMHFASTLVKLSRFMGLGPCCPGLCMCLIDHCGCFAQGR